MLTKNASLRAMLYTSASVLALAVVASQVRAADLPMPTKAPVACAPVVTMFLAGGTFSTGGGGHTPGSSDLNSLTEGVGFSEIAGVAVKPRMGYEGSGGVDYQFACSPWHVSFDVTYGAATSRSKAFHTSTGTLGVAGFFSANGVLRTREDHLVADFMVGHDYGIGGGKGQIQFGLRVADLNATTDGSGNFFSQYGALHTFAGAGSFQQKSQFVGVGPRIAYQGSNPLQGPWSFDYGVGGAALFGERKLSLSGNGAACGNGGGFCGNGSFGFTNNKNGVVWNADASAALAYAVTPHFKVAVGFKIDAYWDPIRTFDTAGNVANTNRYYYGPFLKATGTF